MTALCFSPGLETRLSIFVVLQNGGISPFALCSVVGLKDTSFTKNGKGTALNFSYFAF